MAPPSLSYRRRVWVSFLAPYEVEEGASTDGRCIGRDRRRERMEDIPCRDQPTVDTVGSDSQPQHHFALPWPRTTTHRYTDSPELTKANSPILERGRRSQCLCMPCCGCVPSASLSTSTQRARMAHVPTAPPPTAASGQQSPRQPPTTTARRAATHDAARPGGTWGHGAD